MAHGEGYVGSKHVIGIVAWNVLWPCRSVLNMSTWYCHSGSWPWGLRWVDVPLLSLMCLSWKPSGPAVDVPRGLDGP